MRSNSVFSIREGKVVFLQASGGQKKLVTAADVIDTGGQNDAQISQALSAFIKQRKLNFADSRVTVLIPRSRAILRHMSFPSHRQDEIRSMIDLQVGSRIPFSRDEVEIDFQVLSKTPDGYAKVVVVIVPQETAMRYWKIFSDAAVPVHEMTLSSTGLWLLYQQPAGDSEKPVAIFDMDVDYTEICLCYKTYWLNSREIPIGFGQIQKDGGAEILKQWELTQNNPGGEKLTGGVRSVYLVNSTNDAQALAAQMAKAQDDLTIKEINLTKTLGTGRGVQWPKPIKEGVSVASLAGIACSWEKPPIDLIPRAVKQSQERRLYNRQLVIAGIWMVVALICVGLASGMGFFKKNVQLSRLESRLRDTKRDAFKVNDQLQKIDDIEGMIRGRLIFSDLAREINRLLPLQVYLVSISISGANNLSLEGVSANSEKINEFQRSMVASQTFAKVTLEYVNTRVTQQGEVDYFKITCMLRSVDGQK